MMWRNVKRIAGLVWIVILILTWAALPLAPRWETPADGNWIHFSSVSDRLIMAGARGPNDPTIVARLIDAEDGRELRRFVVGNSIMRLLASRDAAYLLAVLEHGSLELWETGAGSKIARLPMADFNAAMEPPIDINDDGSRVAYVAYESGVSEPAAEPKAKVIRVWDRRGGADIARFSSTGAPFDLSPDGSLIATADMSNSVQLWDCDTGNLLATFPSHNRPISDVTFSADGTWLASVAPGGTELDQRPTEIQMYDVHQRSVLASLDAIRVSDVQLRFDQSGRILTANVLHGVAHLAWRVDSLPPRALPEALSSFAVSADGSVFAFTDGDPVNMVLFAALQNPFVRLVDTKTGDTLSELRLVLPDDDEVTAQVGPAAFSPDARTLWVHVICRDTFWRRWMTGRSIEFPSVTDGSTGATAPRLCGELWGVDRATQRVTARLPSQTWPGGLDVKWFDEGRLMLAQVERGERRYLAAWPTPPSPSWWARGLVLGAAVVTAIFWLRRTAGKLTATWAAAFPKTR
jgi:hypothetical protein